VSVSVDNVVAACYERPDAADEGATRGVVMAIAVELTYRGPEATVEGYNKILSDAGITPGGSHPDPECLFHWATKVPGGFRVTDVWTSREKWDAFEATGLPGQLGTPTKDFYEVVNYLT
jgi:hypothetical protein